MDSVTFARKQMMFNNFFSFKSGWRAFSSTSREFSPSVSHDDIKRYTEVSGIKKSRSSFLCPEIDNKGDNSKNEEDNKKTTAKCSRRPRRLREVIPPYFTNKTRRQKERIQTAVLEKNVSEQEQLISALRTKLQKVQKEYNTEKSRLQEEILKNAALDRKVSDQQQLISSLRTKLQEVQKECMTRKSRNSEYEMSKLQIQVKELITENCSLRTKMRKVWTCSLEHLDPMFRNSDETPGNESEDINITTVGETVESEAAGLNKSISSTTYNISCRHVSFHNKSSVKYEGGFPVISSQQSDDESMIDDTMIPISNK